MRKQITFRNEKLTKTSIKKFSVNCTGDCCVGDIVQFEKAVFGGSYRKPKFLYNEQITAEILKDSYGADKQQHTFTIQILAIDGKKENKKTTIKGRNIYRNGTQRIKWINEGARLNSIEEKHGRGDQARKDKFDRKRVNNNYYNFI